MIVGLRWTVACPEPLRGVQIGTQWVLAGTTVALATCWPMQWGFPSGEPVWWLQLFGLAWACHLWLCSSSPRAAAWGAGLFVTVWLAMTTWWLFVAMHTYGGLASGLALLAVLVLSAAVSAFHALALYGLQRSRVHSAWWWPLQLTVWWMMAELARATWLTGFGWGALGYGHTDGPLAALAPWIGVHGVGAAAVWISASCASAWHWRRWSVFAVALAVLGGLWILPTAEFTRPTGRIPVALLQGNIPQNEKFEAGSGVPLALRWYAESVQAEHRVLVVAPETAIPLLPQELPDGYWAALERHFSTGDGAALLGIPLGDGRQGYTNSVLGLRGEAQGDYRYDKHHLVPFGEFIPPWFKWFTQMMNIPLGDFERGGLGQPSFVWLGQRLAPNICYEDLFGEELGRRFLDETASPTIFVNISNLGWFGDTVIIDQHLQISRMRALEFQRPFLRATNTGSTEILDHRAQSQAKLPRFTRGVLHGEVEGRTGTTPYAWWVGRVGVWPFWLMAGLVVLLARRQRAAQDGGHGGS